MGTQIIRPARIDEADFLQELTQRSVMHWGYEPAFLEWEPETIEITPAFLNAATASYVLEDDGIVSGYYTLSGSAPILELSRLFIDTPYIGTGRGRLLWNHAMATAKHLGAIEVTFDADPNAVPFYRAMGATWLGEEATSWPGWNLHHFEARVAS